MPTVTWERSYLGTGIDSELRLAWFSAVI